MDSTVVIVKECACRWHNKECVLRHVNLLSVLRVQQSIVETISGAVGPKKRAT
jgi:hypothetical protein